MHLSQQELLDDLYQLATLLSEIRPDPYTNCGGPLAFRRQVRQLAEAIPEQGLDVLQFSLLLRPFIASLRDGAGTFERVASVILFHVKQSEGYGWLS